MAKDKKREALDIALGEIEKRFGQGTIMRLGEASANLQVEAIPTGSLALDLALGIGGIPRGRVTEIFGPEMAGKSTLAQHVVAQAQALGGTAAYVDVEHALEPTYAAGLGVNIDELLVSQPDTGEQALEITEALVRSNAVAIIVIDSVAALVPRAEIEGEMGDSLPGLQARLMSQALRKLIGAIARSNTAVVFINQLREKIGIVFGNPETTPGGRALKFYSSVRIDVRRIETLKQGQQVVGSRVRAKVVKNKVAPPFRMAEFDIMFDAAYPGISREGDLLDMGVELETIKKMGSFFSYGELRLGQGRENSKAYLRENPTLTAEIEREVRAACSLPPLPGGEAAGEPKKASQPAPKAEPATEAEPANEAEPAEAVK